MVKLQKPKHPIHLKPAEAKRLGYYYDEAAADRAVRFFSTVLRHSKGQFAGKPFILSRWQEFEVVRPLFGWKRISDGTRRFRRGSIWIPKKNGKSTLAAGIALYLLVADDEPGAEIYSAATDHNQAAIIYREAAQMVRQSTELGKRLRPVDTTKTIAYKEAASFYAALSADAPNKEGINAHAVIIDELHAHKSRTMFDTLFYSGAARRQPLMLSISTAGVYDPEGVGWKEYQFAKRILDKDSDFFDPEYLAVVYEASEKSDWRKPATWRRANPSMPEVLSEEAMASECRRAIEQPDLINAFKRYRLNIWTNSAEAWVPMDAWARCGGEASPADVMGLPCFGGLDLSTTTDISAWARVWMGPEDLYVKMHYFIPEDGMRRRMLRDRVPYDQWAAAGHVTATPGNVVDYAFIRERIIADATGSALAGVGYDPWNATHLALELQDAGLNMVEVRQGYRSLSEPMKKLMGFILSGRLHHGGDPVLTWMANNVVCRTDPNGNIAPHKANSVGRIDGIVAIIMGMALAINEEAPKAFVYTGMYGDQEPLSEEDD